MTMAAGDRLVFVHLPKAGGSWVSQQLAYHGVASFQWYTGRFPIEKGLGGFHGHAAARQLPLARTGRTTLATIRDPWSWYRSWFMMAEGVCYDGHNWLNHQFMKPMNGTPIQRFRAWLPTVLDPSKAVAHNGDSFYLVVPSDGHRAKFHDGVLEYMKANSCGLYQWLQHWMFEDEAGQSLVDHWVRWGHLEADTARLAELHGGPLYRDAPPCQAHNATAALQGQELSKWYTKALIAKVAKAEQRTLARWGFETPGGPATKEWTPCQ